MADKIKAFIAGTPKNDMWIKIERDGKEKVKLPIQKDELQAIQNAIIQYQHNEAVEKAIKKYANHL
jgi:hypothetical protein